MPNTAFSSISMFSWKALILPQVLRVRSGEMPIRPRSVMNRSARSISTRLAVPFFALDRQRHDHAVVVRDLQGVGLRRAFVGLEFDVAADDQHPIGGPAEADDPLVAEIQRVAAQVHHARPAGDRDRQDEFLVVLILSGSPSAASDLARCR